MCGVMARYKNIELLDCMVLSGKSNEFCEGVMFALEQVDKLPTADVEEVKHGKWIETGYFDHLKTPIYRCSECWKEVADHHIKLHKRCLHCGAKMDGGASN